MNGSDNCDQMGKTQDNFILPTLPVGGLSNSQNQLDRMKLVCDCTILPKEYIG